MTLQQLATVSLLITASLPFVPIPQAQAIPPNQIAANPWQPVALINPQKAYKIQLINQTGIELEYSPTTNEFAPRRLGPGQSVVLSSLPLPIYLLINPVSPRFNLKYIVSAKNNLVTVKVQQLPERSPGDTTLNIQKTGGIFVY